MPDTEVWTIGRLLKWTTDHLAAHGSPTARLDAELLLASAKGCQRIELYTAYDEVADETTRAAFREFVKRRTAGTPVAYLLGRREFYGLSFRVTPDVLVPRPETEFVVVTLLDRARPYVAANGSAALRIADVGTGSGIIAVCAVKHVPGCRVTAIDISPRALAVAAANVAEHKVADAIELVESDLFADLPAGQQFDFVVSNPPYISTDEMRSLPIDVKNHEPAVALAAGARGADIIARLIPQAADRLLPGGWLILEISPMIHELVRQLFADDGRFEVGPVVKDLAGHARVMQAQRNSN